MLINFEWMGERTSTHKKRHWFIESNGALWLIVQNSRAVFYWYWTGIPRKQLTCRDTFSQWFIHSSPASGNVAADAISQHSVRSSCALCGHSLRMWKQKVIVIRSAHTYVNQNHCNCMVAISCFFYLFDPTAVYMASWTTTWRPSHVISQPWKCQPQLLGLITTLPVSSLAPHGWAR